MPEPSVAGTLVIQNGQYVLQHRDDKPDIVDPGMYALWGGRLEAGETPLEGAVRELYEETALVVEPEDLKHLDSFITAGKQKDFIGTKVAIHIYYLELGADRVIEQHEGQGIVRLGVGSVSDDKKMTDFVKQ